MSTIRKYCDYYYQVKKVEGGFKYFIYNKYGKDKETIEQGEQIVDTEAEAEQDAIDAIIYHYI